MEEVKTSPDYTNYEIFFPEEPKTIMHGILATIFISGSLLVNHNYIFSSILYFFAILFSISLLLSIKKKVLPDMLISKKGIIFQQSMVEHLLIEYKEIDKIVEKGKGISIFTKDKIYQTDFIRNKSNFLDKLEGMFSQKMT
jgi:hypothetical protein